MSAQAGVQRVNVMFSRVIVLVSGLVFGLATVAVDPAFAGGYGGKKPCHGCNMPPSKVVRTYSDVWHKKVVPHTVVIPKKKVVNHNKLILYKHIKRHHDLTVHKTTYIHRTTIVHRHNTYKKHVKHDQHIPHVKYVKLHKYETRHKHVHSTIDCGCGKGHY
jgi:hypothetical protein